MLLNGIPVSEVDWSHLQALVDEKVAESLVLDYKRDLPRRVDKDKVELLRDVSAMANAAGGVILFGVDEARDEEGMATQIPESLYGVPKAEVAQAIVWLEQVVRSGLDPKLTHFQVRSIEQPDGDGRVVVLAVSSSLLKPHAVAFGSPLPFWRRMGATKAHMATAELRQAFLERESWLDQVKRFRKGRIEAFRARNRTGPLATVDARAALLMHVLPLGRLDQWIDLTAEQQELDSRLNLKSNWTHSSFNFDGLLQHGFHHESVVKYFQWFRFGGVELFGTCLEENVDSKSLGLDVVTASLRAVEWSYGATSTMEAMLRMSPPFAICISLLGIRTMKLNLSSSLRQSLLGLRGEVPSQQIDSDLELPELFIAERPGDHVQMAKMIRLHLDAVWQAGGCQACPMFNADGDWTGREIDGWSGVL